MSAEIRVRSGKEEENVEASRARDRTLAIEEVVEVKLR
jgi:hypothetical protein